jgi:hypothetical protein
MVASPFPQFSPASRSHVHLADEVCPYCEQPIPNDRAQEIQERFKAKEREQAEALKRQMNEQLARERQQFEANAKAAVEKSQTESAAAIEKIKAESLAQQTAARNEGIEIAEAAAQERIEALVAANEALQATAAEKVAEAERQKNEALSEAQNLKANIEDQVNQRAQEIREAMEKDKTDALNAEKAQHFDETLKLKTMVENLQRRLDQKTAGELGEGAEVNLFEELKAEYPDDHITRVPKGTAGADIIHLVRHNGKECGKIVYDSKNRMVWRDHYVTKLRKDQIDAKAEHAVLSTCKFPGGTHQLEVREGVIIANPARVLMIAEILRSHIIQTSSLRIARKERDGKTTALYSYITSERFWQHLKSFDSSMDKALEIDAGEKKAHDAVWEKRGRLIKSAQKSYGNVRADIERIIGTAESD